MSCPVRPQPNRSERSRTPARRPAEPKTNQKKVLRNLESCADENLRVSRRARERDQEAQNLGRTRTPIEQRETVALRRCLRLGLLALGAVSAAAASNDDAAVNPCGAPVSLWRRLQPSIVAWRAPRFTGTHRRRHRRVGSSPHHRRLRCRRRHAGGCRLVVVVESTSCSGSACSGAVLWLTRRHRGRLDRHAALDAFIVGSGAGLITWVTLVVPALDHDLHPALAIVPTPHLPLAVSAVHVHRRLVARRRARRQSGDRPAGRGNELQSRWLRCLQALVQVEHVGNGALPVTFALFVVAIVLLSLALLHPRPRDGSVTSGRSSTGTNCTGRRAPPRAARGGDARTGVLDRTGQPQLEPRPGGRTAGAFAVALALDRSAADRVARDRPVRADTRRASRITTSSPACPTRARFIVDVTESLERTWRTEHLPDGDPPQPRPVQEHQRLDGPRSGQRGADRRVGATHHRRRIVRRRRLTNGRRRVRGAGRVDHDRRSSACTEPTNSPAWFGCRSSSPTRWCSSPPASAWRSRRGAARSTPRN